MNENIYNISCRKVLDKLNLKYTTTSSGELQLVCPNPFHHDSPHDGGSFFMNEKELVFNCFGCDWKGSIFTFISLYLQLPSFNDAVNWLKDDNNFFFDEVEFVKSEVGKRIQKLVELESEIDKNPFYLPKVIDIKSKRILNFFEKRQISKEVALQYGAKFCFEGWYQNRIILPIFHDKKLYGFEARIIDKSLSQSKCLYPPNSALKQIIYDIDYLDRTQPLYFVEGMMDCLSLKSRGFTNSSCSFGSKVTDRQVKLLNTFSSIILIPDRDEAGESMINLFYEKVKMPTVYIVKLPDNRDVDECTFDELNECIKLQTSISDYIVDRDLHISPSYSNNQLYSSKRFKKAQ